MIYLRKNFYRAYEVACYCRQRGFSFVTIFAYLIYKAFKVCFRLSNIESAINYHMISELGSVQDIEDDPILQQIQNDIDAQPTIIHTGQRKKFIWFTPNCSNVWGGGHFTIFRFANYFANQHDVTNIIFIYDYKPEHRGIVLKLERDLKSALPNCQLEVETQFDLLPACDAAIATSWQSAYYVQSFGRSRHKFYFMQDYESLFYPGGSLSLQANYTYSFGFHGITGGGWLKQIYESYGNEAENYIFSTDKEIFYPRKSNLASQQVKRLFFYGRPSTERRAYELGIMALSLIAESFPNLEIVIAGLAGLAQPKFKCKLLGNLSLQETGELYRSCDIGIALSATNLSYLPVELMASGCPVVTNAGPQVEWYCKDQYNSLIATPTPQGILKCVKMLMDSGELREKLIKNGLETANQTTWDKEMEKIYQYIISKIE